MTPRSRGHGKRAGVEIQVRIYEFECMFRVFRTIGLSVCRELLRFFFLLHLAGFGGGGVRLGRSPPSGAAAKRRAGREGVPKDVPG